MLRFIFSLVIFVCLLLAACEPETDSASTVIEFRSVPWDAPGRIEQWVDNGIAFHDGTRANLAVSGTAGLFTFSRTGSPSNELELFGVRSDEHFLLQYPVREMKFGAPAFSPDGNMLAVTIAPPTYYGISKILLIEIARKCIAAEIGDPRDYISDLIYSHDGAKLYFSANRFSETLVSTYNPEYSSSNFLSLFSYSTKDHEVKYIPVPSGLNSFDFKSVTYPDGISYFRSGKYLPDNPAKKNPTYVNICDDSILNEDLFCIDRYIYERGKETLLTKLSLSDTDIGYSKDSYLGVEMKERDGSLVVWAGDRSAEHGLYRCMPSGAKFSCGLIKANVLIGAMDAVNKRLLHIVGNPAVDEFFVQILNFGDEVSVVDINVPSVNESTAQQFELSVCE